MSSKISSDRPFRPLRLLVWWLISVGVAYLLGYSHITADSIGIHIPPPAAATSTPAPADQP